MATPDQTKKLEAAAEKFRSGELQGAESLCREILKVDAWHISAMNLLAGILRQTQRLPEALEIMEKIVNLAPGVPELQVNCGELFAETGRPERAMERFQTAIKLRPNYPRAWLLGGMTLHRGGRANDAIAYFEQVLKIEPQNVLAMLHLADIAHEQSRTTQQLKYAEMALRADPRNALAKRMRAAAWFDAGRIGESIQELREILKEAPRDIAVGTNLMLNLAYDPQVSPAELQDAHEKWVASFYGEVPLKGKIPAERGPLTGRALRVGYVSPDFREHAVAKFFQPVIAHHDPSKVESYCYFSGGRPDTLTAWFREHCGHWRDVAGMPTEELVGLIQKDEIDILVDLTGHTRGHRLDAFARRAAPVQATWLGYPCTTGMKNVDYLISDGIIDPVGEPSYSTEQIWRLPRVFCPMQPQADVAIAPLPAMTRGFVTFGSMHGLPKLNDQVLRLWAAVLNAVPNSRLFIYRSSLLPSVQPLWRQRCQAQGIDPGRVIMAYEKPSSGTHLDVYREMDIHLDSLPWNGHTTACEALWMGVPTVTLRGNRHSGRMSASMLHNVGLDQFIADSAAQYVSIAADAARDLAALGSLRQRLRKQMEASPLMDGARFTRELEAAFAEMARLAGGDAA